MRVGRLDAVKREELLKAKDKEIQNWLKNSAAEVATRSDLSCWALLRTRWVITEKPTGLKARLVVQGFTDPDVAYLRREVPDGESPSSSVIHIHKGHATSAFLHGDAGELERGVLWELVKELAAALGIPQGTAVRLRKAVYALVNAPRQWWADVRS